MENFVHLVGAEQVRNAASSIQASAETMRHSSSFLTEALAQHQRFMSEWIERFENALDKEGD
ncbi:hypothetical protein LCGC14_0288690 [marine sediment metagenome]|uniref:Uncharacterized protein n=1 Tax=marine sediment metagenome TaxID=412755 RepID=A0A0F9UAP4_9ZZZZ